MGRYLKTWVDTDLAVEATAKAGRLDMSVSEYLRVLIERDLQEQPVRVEDVLKEVLILREISTANLRRLLHDHADDLIRTCEEKAIEQMGQKKAGIRIGGSK